MRVLIVQGGEESGYISGEKSVIETDIEHFSEGITSRVMYLKCSPFGILWSIKTSASLCRVIDDFKPDIVHFHTIIPYLSLSVLQAAKKKNVRVVQTLHNGRWLCTEGGFYRNGRYCDKCVGASGFEGAVHGCGRGRLPAFLLSLTNYTARSTGYLFSRVDQFIAVSKYVKDQYIKSGFPRDKIVVRNNCINLSDSEKVESSSICERSGIAFAGRISWAKGVAILEHLIPKINQKIHLVGDGPQLEYLQQFCSNNEYMHVVFHGAQSRQKTLEILGKVLCTIVPSQCGETFSLVAAESMAVGTPIVASDIGGLSDLIRNSEGGVLVAPEDSEGFVDAVKTFFNSRELAGQMGESGKRYILDNLSASEKAMELRLIYDGLLSDAPNIP